MRLTDYAKFNGGAWFYTPRDYRRWMEQTAALLPGMRFLLFSDVPVETLLPELLKPHAESAEAAEFVGGDVPAARRNSEPGTGEPGAGIQHSAFSIQHSELLPGPEHPVSALHAMSLCDYIIGPPSTFSGWASFMGRVPRLQLKSRDQAVRLEDFVTPS